MATVQRIEEGKIKRDIKYGTKRAYERALGLPDGWIDRFLSGEVDGADNERGPIIIEGEGERLLVAITDGASKLSVTERRAVLALVRGLQQGPDA